MKTKLFIVLAGIASLSALAYRLAPSERQAPDEAVAGYAPYRLDGATYDHLSKLAQAGDCDAAYRLGRHHMFFSLNMEEAVRWYRIAAKCPDVRAKNELVGVLMHTSDDDAEIERLLSEIEQIDAKLAESPRQSVAAARSFREHHSQ